MVPFQQGMRRGLETNFAETEYVGSPQQSKMFRTRQLNKGASQISLRQGKIRGLEAERIYSHFFFFFPYVIAWNKALHLRGARAGAT